MLKFQDRELEPSEEERSYYDYTVISRDLEQKKILLQIAMIRRTRLDEYLNLLRDIGLSPAAARPSSLGLHEIFALHDDGFPKKEPVVVLDANPGSVEMVVIVSSERFYSDKLQISAESLDLNEIMGQLYAFLSRLRLKTGAVGKLYTTGRLGAELLALLQARFPDCESLAHKLRLKETALVAANPDLVPTIGLAMSGLTKVRNTSFNLIPAERRVIARKPSLIPTFVLAGLLLILSLTAVGRDYRQSNTLLNAVDEQVKKLQPQVNQVLTLKSKVEQRQKELDEIRDLMKGEQQVLFVLKDLTERLPEDTYLQTLNIERGRGDHIGLLRVSEQSRPALRNLGQL